MAIKSLLSLIVCLAMFSQNLAAAQAAATPPKHAAPVVPDLRVLVLEGQGGYHNVQTPTASSAVVEVRDVNDRPVEGAEVVFQLPVDGPGGAFPGGRSQVRTRTNFQGQAAASGFVPNGQTGRFQIEVNASFGDHAGSALISQTNSAGFHAAETKKRLSRRKGLWLLVGLAAGAGIVAGIVLANRSGEPPEITLALGNPSVGGPR